MFKFSAVSQIWKKYIQKLNDWDLPLKFGNVQIGDVTSDEVDMIFSIREYELGQSHVREYPEKCKHNNFTICLNTLFILT